MTSLSSHPLAVCNIEDWKWHCLGFIFCYKMTKYSSKTRRRRATRKSKMLLLPLPAELNLQIAAYLETLGLYRRCRDINSFAQTCRDLYITVDPLLYSLDVKVDCDLYSRHSTALHYAAQIGLVRTPQETFQAGAKACSKSLFLAIRLKQVKMFNLLLDAGVWPEKELLDHLASAARAGEDEIVKELLLGGADPSVPLYGYLKPPLLEACERPQCRC